MAALARLQQRIKENFHETTRDISLLAGGSGSSTANYFDTSDDKLKEISTLLESRQERERLEGMKRIIAGISKGRNMEPYFAQVVKNVVSPSIEIRKLVYIYLLRFASTNSDLLLLSINTFQKDLSDSSPLIRSMSLRVLTSIRVSVIQGIVMLGLKKLVHDRNPWVRKTVAVGLAKVYEVDPSAESQLISLLQILLAAHSPLILGSTLTAFLEICPDRLDLLHPFYRHICQLIVDADEWGQVVAVDVLVRYARTMLEKPEEAAAPPTAVEASDEQAKKDAGQENGSKVDKGDGEESEDEFAGIDIDLAMFLHCAKPLFQSRNPAVVLAITTAYFHLAPKDHALIGQRQLVAPLLRLASMSDRGRAGGREISTLTWEIIAAMAEERAWLFAEHLQLFFCYGSEPTTVKVHKIRAMMALVTEDTAAVLLREFRHCARDPEDAVAGVAVRAIGRCIRTQPDIAQYGLATLLRILKSPRDAIVAEAVLVLKNVIISGHSGLSEAVPAFADPQQLVARLALGLEGITNASARATVYWLVGHYAASTKDNPEGQGWAGLALWVPDTARLAVLGFTDESVEARLQILTLIAKIQVLTPVIRRLQLLSQYAFALGKVDPDYSVRDRARFLHALLRGVRDEQKELRKVKVKSEAKDDEAGVVGDNEEERVEEEEEEEEDRGGVILRREQIKVVLFGERKVAPDNLVNDGSRDYAVGSLSRVTKKKLAGYEPIPEWTDEPTDSSLRDVERQRPPSSVPTPAIATPPTGIPNPTPIPLHLSSSAASLPRSTASSSTSPAGSLPAHPKAKFKDLERFLDSESDTEEESGEEDEDSDDGQPAPVMAPPRSVIVPEYDLSSSEAESESEEGSLDEETAALYGGFR